MIDQDIIDGTLWTGGISVNNNLKRHAPESVNVNGAIRQAQVNEVEGLSNLRRMPFRAVLGTSCSVKYAGNRKTNTIQRKEIETYNRMKNLGGQPEKV